MNYLKNIMTATATVLALGIGTASVAQADELRLASYLPPTHFGTRLIIEPMIERIAEYTDGSITVQNFPGGQLANAPGTLNAVTSGIANMGFIGIGYVGDTMPMSTIIEIPGAFGDLRAGHSAYWQLIEDHLLEAEFLPAGIRPIMMALLPQTQIVLAGAPEINSLADMAGLKIRVPHAAAAEAIEALGMIPVELPISELYLAIERGTVDGAVVLTASVTSYNLQEVTDSITTNLAMGSVGFVVGINEDDWQGLSADEQEQLMRAGVETGEASVDVMLSVNGRAETALAEAGMNMITLSDEVLAEIAEALSSVEANWVESVSARNEMAAEIAAAYQANLAAQ
jgi:TRAP-type C4-dicarboxylate transport system substrate-binding protein